MDIPIGSPCEVLLWAMSSPGIAILLGGIVSVLVEYLPLIGIDWGSLDHRVKRVVMLAICLAVPLVALGAASQGCGVAINADSIWDVVVAGLAAFAGSQVAHIRKLGRGGR